MPGESTRVTPEFPGRLLHFGDLAIDTHSLSVRGPRGAIPVTPGEYRILVRLVDEMGETVPHAEIAVAIGVEQPAGQHAVDLALGRLRSHLHGRTQVRVESIYGVGYRLSQGRGPGTIVRSP